VWSIKKHFTLTVRRSIRSSRAAERQKSSRQSSRQSSSQTDTKQQTDTEQQTEQHREQHRAAENRDRNMRIDKTSFLILDTLKLEILKISRFFRSAGFLCPSAIKGYARSRERIGAEVACWAHNPKVARSKLAFAIHKSFQSTNYKSQLIE
jgi:hypothetical protein